MEYIAPVAVDLGAATSGIWSSLYVAGGDPSEAAMGTAISVSPGSFQIVMRNRTSMRHMRRGYKRRKLAKKLVRLWLQSRWPQATNELERLQLLACQRFVMGLLNRRGFTYFSADEEINPELIDGYVDELSRLGVALGTQTPSEWLKSSVASPEEVPTLLKTQVFTLTDRTANKNRKIAASAELTKFVKGKLDDSSMSARDIKKVVTAVNHLRGCLQHAVDSTKTGHKHRSDYFAAILADLDNTIEGKQACAFLDMTPHALANLIGHIGNLNLPALRAYFHDKTKSTSRQLDVQRFGLAWRGFFERWTLAGESGEREVSKRQFRRKWLDHLKLAHTTHALWELLTKHNPTETIPPFEAQTNRRPPVCQNLLLNIAALDSSFPPVADGAPAQWEVWSQNLERNDATKLLAAGLDDISAHDAKVIQRSPVSRGDLKPLQVRWRRARLLQRVLDRSKRIDPFGLRLLASEAGVSHGASYAQFHSRLSEALGTQHVGLFLDFARKYYSESRQARAGNWFDSQRQQGRLLARCNAHPPHKIKLIDTLVSGVLSCQLPEGTVEQMIRPWLDQLRLTPPANLLGRARRARGATGLLAEFSDLQKEFGGDLKIFLQDAHSVTNTDRKSLSEKDSRARAWNAYRWAEVLAQELGQRLHHTDAQIARYANPYSLAQLHQILYTDRGGFASNCRGCTGENAWRATFVGENIANASRLPADSVRPFDGALARLLKAQASRIAQAVVVNRIWPQDMTRLSIPLLLEENRFEFAEQLATVKDQKGKLKQLKERGEKRRAEWEGRWHDKWQRIRDAVHGICPYCAKPIGANGDFDHIVSQASTRDVAGYGFDAEPNLIWAHKACNQHKGRSVYLLENLANDYLIKIFGGNDRASIGNRIRQSCQRWLDAHADRRAFHQLDAETQLAVRHALFLPDLRGQVLARLANQNRARVNGTQRWFAAQLAQALKSAFAREGVNFDIEFSVHRIMYTDVGELRGRLAADAPNLFAKASPQPPYSHCVDAALVFATASTNPALRPQLGLASTDDAQVTEFLDAGRAAVLLPRALQVVRIQRRPKYAAGVKAWNQPLLKAGMFGERFLPIGVDAQQRVWIGFSSDNRLQLQTPAPGKNKKAKIDPRLVLLQSVWSVLQVPPGMTSPQLSELATLASQRAAGVLWLKVERVAAFRHLLANKRDPDDVTSKFLRGLLYHTQRVSLAKVLNLDGAMPAPNAKELLKRESFAIKITLPGIKLNGNSVTFPAREAWERLLNDPALVDCLGKKIARHRSDDEIADDRAVIDWDALMRRHFPLKDTGREHRRKRQEYSLARIESASGGMRVKRMDPAGTAVFQLLQVDRGAYRGFVGDDSKLGFDSKQPALLSVFEQANNLTPLKPNSVHGGIIGFDQAIELNHTDYPKLTEHGIEKLQLFPATDSRRRMCMTLKWATLKQIIPELQPTESFRTEHAELALDANQVRTLASTMQTIIGAGSLGPRSGRLQIEHMDDTRVTLSWGGGAGGNKKAINADSAVDGDDTDNAP